jgi:hypothetical protein
MELARCNPTLGLSDQFCLGEPEDWSTRDIDRALLRDLAVIGSDGLLGILGALLLDPVCAYVAPERYSQPVGRAHSSPPQKVHGAKGHADYRSDENAKRTTLFEISAISASTGHC